MLLLLSVAAAHAFCGTYVGPLGSSFENTASQVIVAHDADFTTLTLAADVAGTSSAFAMLVPVPAAIGEGDVRLADPALFDVFGAWSAPRVVSYTCSDFLDTADTDGDTGGGGGEAVNGVTVEAEFTLGSYSIVVLSASGGEGLYTWLGDNGFELPASAVPILDEYVAADQHFVAAKVDLDAEPGGGAYLQPLQLRYPSTGDSFVLPIRIGTTVSPGEQEVIAYVLTPRSDGAVGVSNYAEAQVEASCMPPEGTQVDDAFYEGQLETAFASGMWLREYAWDASSCDPCSAEPPTVEDLAEAGAGASTFVTRLRLRYTAAQATEDVVIYPTHTDDPMQVKYVEYVHELEDRFPVCGVGMVDDPGTCDEGASDGDSGSIWGDPPEPGAEDTASADTFAGGAGCASTGGAAATWAVGLAALAAMGRRRR